MPPPPPDPALTARFQSDLAALTGTLPVTLGIAVSGGADSLGLLLLARDALGEAVEAATVDHGLRPESPGEAAYVAGLCRLWGIPHRVLHASTLVGNRQQAARTARYHLLSAWAAERRLLWIATGHHRDDQAETLLMRAVRGAGLSGLASIRAVIPPGEAADLMPAGGGLVRPVLGWSRAELGQVVADAGIEAIADPSNADPAYDRAAFRDLLRREPLLDPRGLAKAAENLRDVEAVLAYAAAAAWDARVSRHSDGLLLRPDGLPRELLRRLVGRILGTLCGHAPRGSQVAVLVDTLASGGRGNIGGVLAIPGSSWRFAPEPERTARSIINHSRPSSTLPTEGERLSKAQRKVADE